MQELIEACKEAMNFMEMWKDILLSNMLEADWAETHDKLVSAVDKTEKEGVIEALPAILEEPPEPPPLPNQAALLRELGERVVSLEAQVEYLQVWIKEHRKMTTKRLDKL